MYPKYNDNFYKEIEKDDNVEIKRKKNLNSTINVFKN